jgi:hypothetical protein
MANEPGANMKRLLVLCAVVSLAILLNACANQNGPATASTNTAPVPIQPGLTGSGGGGGGGPRVPIKSQP